MNTCFVSRRLLALRWFIGVALIASIMAYTETARGVVIPISNFSFEGTPDALDGSTAAGTIQDWSDNGTNRGTVDPNPSISFYPLTPADGDQYAWVSNPVYLRQQPTTFAAVPITYTLTVDVAGLVGGGFTSPYVVSILDPSNLSGTPLASASGDRNQTNEWLTVSVAYFSSGVLNGQPFWIELKTPSGTQTLFDNVHLVDTPEPGSLGMLALGGVGLVSCKWRGRRRIA